jgi:negative regulator of genetic competence, sporulation and motility
MILRLLQSILLSSLLVGCFAGLSPIEKAGESYKQNKDYASLKDIHSGLFKGIGRNAVERLLGEPDYSPIDGQYYYSSDYSKYSEEREREVAVGLVVDYRDRNGRTTERLQEYWLGIINE